MPSPATMSCISGHSPYMICEDWVPRNSMASSVLEPLTISVSKTSSLNICCIETHSAWSQNSFHVWFCNLEWFNYKEFNLGISKLGLRLLFSTYNGGIDIGARLGNKMTSVGLDQTLVILSPIEAEQNMAFIGMWYERCCTSIRTKYCGDTGLGKPRL